MPRAQYLVLDRYTLLVNPGGLLDCTFELLERVELPKWVMCGELDCLPVLFMVTRPSIATAHVVSQRDPDPVGAAYVFGFTFMPA
jgi:hypothetical protein